MGRKLRYLPEEGALVEVTCRTLQGRLLLRPSPELNDIAAGVLGRAPEHPSVGQAAGSAAGRGKSDLGMMAPSWAEIRILHQGSHSGF